MDWGCLTVVSVFITMASSQIIRYPCAFPTPAITPAIAPAIAPAVPTIVDGNVVQSLIDTLQLFIVSDLLEETLPEKKVIASSPVYIQDDCDILPYEFVYDNECPSFVTSLVPRPTPTCVNLVEPCVNFGLNKELVLPPLAAELPCGLGYLPGALPVVAKAFAPSSKCCACGCGCTPCSTAAFPICSPYSCAALAAPLNPDMTGLIKPIIL